MTAPICPNHPQGPKPMQAGKGGAWFCPNKMADQSWCKHRVQGAPAQVAAAQPVPAAHLPASTGGEALAAAALVAASKLYQGAGPEMSEMVIQTAQRFYAAMKALVA